MTTTPESPPPLPDAQCVAFLQWALPRLGMRWPGFRQVRRQVCRRLRHRLGELGLPDLTAYRAHLAAHPAEWRELDARCRITISRFCRDRVFCALGQRVLPALARRAAASGRKRVRAWSVGCASGEEVYTLVLIWRLGGGDGGTGLQLEVLGTDIDPVLLQRARRACFPGSSLREVPETWQQRAFRSQGEEACLRSELRPGTVFERQDVREDRPPGVFDLVLCRNLVLTYYREPVQTRVLGTVLGGLRAGGGLMIGAHEALPDDLPGLTLWPGAGAVFRKPQAAG